MKGAVVKFFLALISMVVGGQVWAADAKLKSIDTSRQGGVFRVDLHFDKPVAKDEFAVDFINETVQVNIPGAEIAEKKKVTWVKDDQVKHLYTYQSDRGLRQRIILKNGRSAIEYEGKVNISANGPVLSIEVGEKAAAAKDEGLSAILQALPAKSEVKAEEKSEEAAPIAAEEKKLTADEKALFQAVSRVQESAEAVAADPRKESEIPVFKREAKEAPAGGSAYLRMIVSLLIALGLGAGIFFGVKKYSHKQLSRNKHTSIRVMTQHYLGPKKSLAIVTVAGESILIGITDHNITPIKTLSLLDEEVPEISSESFSDSLKTADVREEAAVGASSSADDDFSIQGIKDIVSERLSGMRNI